MDFWENTLGSPVKIVAPMVDASELPWRILSRRHGAQLCYTPMLHSSIFVRDSKYRKEALATCEEDKPLIIQFCGNDPEVMLEAAKLAENFCCAIDINLGCPQAIAKRGHYGAFLQDEWELIEKIVRTLKENLKIPVTCKIRRFESVEKTINYAKMLEKAGCSMLTLHGRTRDMKGPLTGLADWSYVKAVKDSVNIPVISNGNIQCVQDLHRCLEETGVNGVMVAEGNLHNPAIFEGINPPVWIPAEEYLNLVEEFPCPLSYVRGHLFKLFHQILTLEENAELRIQLGSANSMDLFKKIVETIKDKYFKFHEGIEKWEGTDMNESFDLILPPWLCRSYVRNEHRKIKIDNSDRKDLEIVKRNYQDAEGNPISRKKMKKLRRINRRPNNNSLSLGRINIPCLNCSNPLGYRCNYMLCRKCCKDKCINEELNCSGHRYSIQKRKLLTKTYDELGNKI